MGLRQIKMAVHNVEMTLGSMQDGGGYQSWTPDKAVMALVSILNATLELMPGEPQLPGAAGRIRNVSDKVTEAFQIRLIPFNDMGVIRIEGYATDISQPVYTKEIKVPEWG